MKYWRSLVAGWRAHSLLDRLTAVSHVVVIFAGIAGLLFFAIERWDAQNQARRAMALQFFELSYADDVRAAKQGSNTYILGHAAQFSEARQQREAGVPVTFALPAEAADHFLQLLEFYDQVLICREIEQCDWTLIDKIFHDDMCDFDVWLQIVLPPLEVKMGPGIARRLHSYCGGASAKG